MGSKLVVGPQVGQPGEDLLGVSACDAALPTLRGVCAPPLVGKNAEVGHAALVRPVRKVDPLAAGLQDVAGGGAGTCAVSAGLDKLGRSSPLIMIQAGSFNWPRSPWGTCKAKKAALPDVHVHCGTEHHEHHTDQRRAIWQKDVIKPRR